MLVNKRAVIFGAGSIGRGFIGDLLSRSGFDLVFIDVDESLIKLLNDKGSYTLNLINGNSDRSVDIPIVHAVDGRDIQAVAREVAVCDIIFTAVGMNALPYIAEAVSIGLSMRNDLVNIILCENMSNAHQVLGKLLAVNLPQRGLSRVGLLRASVGRMVPMPKAEEDPLIVNAEPYAHLMVDADGVVGNLPHFVGLEPISPFDFAMERKLYIHNLGHAACAWLGALKGYTFVYEAVGDTDIYKVVKQVMREAAAGLRKKYNCDRIKLNEHIDDLLNRFANKSLGDTLQRVGRDTWRKLGPTDRAVGAFNLCSEYNLPRSTIAQVIAAGLHFNSDDKGTIQLKEMKAEHGLAWVIENICEIPLKEDRQEIIDLYCKIYKTKP